MQFLLGRRFCRIMAFAITVSLLGGVSVVSAQAATAQPLLAASKTANLSAPFKLASTSLTGITYIYVANATGIRSVSYYFDTSTTAKVSTAAPFTGSINPAKITAGTHTIRAIATTSSGKRYSVSAQFSIAKSAATTTKPATAATPTTTAATGFALGAYKWGACTGGSDCATHGPNGLDSYAAWLGSNMVLYGEDNNGDNSGGQTWDFFDNGWAGSFSSWGAWKAKNPKRHLVLAVGMYLPDPSMLGKQQLQNCAAGKYNAHYTNLAASLKKAGLSDTVMRIGWEFDIPGSNWEINQDPVAWKNCWIQMATTMKKTTPTLIMNWNPGRGDYIKEEIAKYGEAGVWPGDNVVDQIGIDIYDTNHDKSDSVFFTNDVGELGWFSQFAAKHKKPLSFPEWGLWDNKSMTMQSGSGDDPVFIQKMHDFMVNPANHVAWASYFDVKVDDNTIHQLQPNWEGGTQYPKASAQFKKLFGGPGPVHSVAGS